MSTQAEIEIDTLGKQLKEAQTTLKLMEPPERGRVALDAARRSLQMTEMASGHDNWSNKGLWRVLDPCGELKQTMMIVALAGA